MIASEGIKAQSNKQLEWEPFLVLFSFLDKCIAFMSEHGNIVPSCARKGEKCFSKSRI